MRKGWTNVRLGEVFDLDLDSVPVDSSVTYEMAGVLSYGRGLFEKPSVSGADTTYKIFYRLGRGQIVLSQLFGWEGAIAPVTPEYEGRFVSSQFPTFRTKKDLDPAFARWLVRNPRLWDQLRSAAKGMGDRRRTLTPELFFAATSTLPPKIEQQRIAAHLDALESRLTQLQKLREESAAESLALLRLLMDEKYCKGIQFIAMRELVSWRSLDTFVSRTEKYRFAGVYCFGRGVFRKQEISGSSFAYDRLTRLRTGELIYPKLMAWEGALGIVPDDCDGCYVSPEFPVFSVNQSKVLPEILDIHFKTPAIWRKLANISTGTNVRRRRLNPNAFLSYMFPLPPMDVQEHVKKIAHHAKMKRELQKNAVTLEKALLPSLLDRIFSGEPVFEDVRVSQVGQLGLPGFSPIIVDVSVLLRQKAALSAYFVHQSGQDKYRGRVKMEKFDQFVEAECGLDLRRNPQALAAGPADMSSREAVEKEAQKNDWYSVQRFNDSNSRTHYEYFAGKNISEAISIAEQFMGDRKPAVDRLIKLLKPLNTHQCSVIATLHSAWSGLLKIQTPVSDERIITASIHSHPEKKKIPMADWNWGLGWLRTNQFVPKGG